MADALDFGPPSNSEGHHALRQAVVDAGFDSDILRDLLWLINAHPKLVAHGQVFANLSQHFIGPVFRSDSLVWADHWKRHVPAWAEITQWIWSHRATLTNLPGLSEAFQFEGKNVGELVSRDHPIMRKGLVRHGIVAAIWNINQGCASYPPRADNLAAQRYFELQGHVLAAYIECRFRLSTREFYENYSEKIERPVAPIRGAAIGPGLREFSLSDYDRLLEQLPAVDSTKAFAQQLISERYSFDGISDAARARARVYMNNLIRYFERYLRVLGGWTPPQALRRGWGGGGSKARRPGFVQYLGAPDVYAEESPPAGDDPDLVGLPGQNVCVDCDEQKDPNALEASGLSPSETLLTAFTLISVEEMGGSFLKVQQQLRAREMGAQQLYFGYDVLTPEEISEVWKAATTKVSQCLLAPRVTDDIWNAAIAGLLVKLCMAYGQSLDSCLSLRLIWITPGTPAHTLSEENLRPALVVSAPLAGDWTGAKLVGLRLPGIMPAYRSELVDDLAEIDGPYADTFVLPDLLRIGAELLSCLKLRPPPEDGVFGLHRKTVKDAFREMLAERHRKRVTFEKIAIYLPRYVIWLTGDQSLSWVMFADETRANEPRMHYTRHPILKIHATYRRAARHLARIVGVRIDPANPPEIAPSDPRDAVGARFVLPLSAIRDILAMLIEFLRNPNIDRDDAHYVMVYHNHYFLYLALFQVLETLTRSPSNADDLYLYWKARQDRRGDVPASLSDKTSEYFDKTRLTMISNSLASQFAHYDAHEKHLTNSPILRLEAATTGLKLGPFFWLDEYDGCLLMSEATQGRLAQLLHEVSGYPIPINFARASIRCELLARGCPAQVVDAFLGHFRHGESPFGIHSTFDYRRWREILTPYLDAIRSELGLRPVASRLIPFPLRPTEKA